MHSSAIPGQIDFRSQGIPYARLRHGLLLGVSFTSAALLAMAAAPEARAQRAASFCTQDGFGGGGTTATCGPGTTTTGISYAPTGSTFHLTFAPNTVVNAVYADALRISSGSAVVTVDAPSTTIFRSGLSGNDGFYLTATAGGTVNFGGLIVSEIDHGIHVEARASGSANTIAIDTSATSRIYSASTGILANSTGGNVTVTNAGLIRQGASTVTSPAFGTITTLSDPSASGIYATTTGTGTITASNTGSITSEFVGIRATTASGAVQIANSGTVTAQFGLVGGSTNGPVTLTNAGVLGGTTIGIVGGSRLGGVDIVNAASGRITFGTFGLAAGSIGGAVSVTNAGVMVQDQSLPQTVTDDQFNAALPDFSGRNPNTTAGIFARTLGSSLSVSNSGSITATNGIDVGIVKTQGTIPAALNLPVLSVSNSGSILATTAVNTSGSTVATALSNTGTITGAVTLSAGSSFVNAGPGTFNATGASTFGGGTIANAGTIALGRDATLGSLSSFVNEAVGRVQGPAGGSATIVSTAFTNAGTISLQNGAVGDTLTIAGNYVGRNGRVDLDVSTQAGTADRLVITGNAGGTTGLNLLNVTPGAAFTTSPVLVQVRGQQEANAFTLASAQNFGALDVSLASGRATGGETTLSLVTTPSTLGQSGPTAAIAARTIAFQGSSAVLDRMTQLRTSVQQAAASGPTAIPQALQYAGLTQYSALVSKDPIAPNLVQPAPVPASTVKPAIWARAFGDLERRTGFSSGTFNGVNAGRDLGYTQSTGGVLVGTDLVMSGITAPDDGLILGVMGGYTAAGVRLNQGAGRQDYEGGTVGTYATYIKGGFFADALFKVDLLGLDITGANLRQSTGLTNYNVLGNVGYRFDLPHALYIEPTAGLEYVATDFDRTTGIAAGIVPLQDGDAFRGRIGARLGSEFVQDDIRVEPSITGLVYDVFSESGTTTAFGGATRLTGLTNVGKVRGEVQASINFLNLRTGVSGFLRADYRIGDDLVGGGGRAGIRYQW